MKKFRNVYYVRITAYDKDYSFVIDTSFTEDKALDITNHIKTQFNLDKFEGKADNDAIYIQSINLLHSQEIE